MPLGRIILFLVRVWVGLVSLLGGLLAGSVDLGSAQVHELLDGVLDSLLSDLDADVVELLLVDLLYKKKKHLKKLKK